jgi:hypothetical protein
VEGVPRDDRRLADKLLLAFHQACDQQEELVASQLLSILEPLFARRSRQVEFNRRLSMETLVAAHERLWHIRHTKGVAFNDLSGQSSYRERCEVVSYPQPVPARLGSFSPMREKPASSSFILNHQFNHWPFRLVRHPVRVVSHRMV